MPDSFISQQDLSDYLGRDVTSDDGALVAVDAACGICRTLAEQSFSEATDTIILDGTGTDALLLPELPVSAAGTVSVNGGTIDDYVLKDNAVLVRRGSLSGSSSWWAGYYSARVWPVGRQNIEVTYDHGYAGTVPADIRMVALSIASRFVIQGPVLQESLGDASVRYAAAATDLTNGEQAILTKYRQLA